MDNIAEATKHLEVPPTSTKEARIEARRRRIEEKNNLISGKVETQRDNADQDKLSIGYQQLADSLACLDNLKTTTITGVTDVRVESEYNENSRRINEENFRQNRLLRMQDEAYTSGQANAVIDMKWSELMDIGAPLDLKELIDKQKILCDEVINSKNKLIEEFRNELKKKDEEYVKSLGQFSREIRLLLQRMKDQYRILQREYDAEFERIEDAFMLERAERLRKHKEELDDLFTQRREMELKYLKDRQNRINNSLSEMENLRMTDGESYNRLKIKLEKDYQILQQQLEEMKATYQLNQEKLEYNFRVLSERDMENVATLHQQKRKEAKLKEILSGLINKYNKMDSKYQSQNQKLTDEFTHSTRAYKDLQKKTKHFLLSDNQIYQEVWAMHQEELARINQRVIQSGSVIAEQQMGLVFNYPSNEEMLSGLVNNPAESSTLLSTTDENKVESRNERYRMKQLCYIYEMLYRECPFLVDNSALEQLNDLDIQDRRPIIHEVIKKALEISSKEDENTLIQYFFSEVDVTSDDEGDDDVISQSFIIPADKIVETTKKFLIDRKESKPAQKTKKGIMLLIENLIKNKDELVLWERYRNMVPEEMNRILKAMQKALIKYNQLLIKRANMAEEVAQLSTQNTELKRLLQQYLLSSVNENLIVPPSQYLYPY